MHSSQMEYQLAESEEAVVEVITCRG